MKLLVLDGNSILNRAFYGIKLLTTKSGEFTNGIVGFLNILEKVKDETEPDAVAIAFDMKAPTFRHKAYAGYKAQRKGMPPELAAQMPVLKELLGDLGYKIVTCEGWEADDILGTFAETCENTDNTCMIATGDRDSLQLVSPKTTVRLATTKFGQSAVTLCDEAYIKETYGVEPKQLIDIKAIQGDTSDNILGVAGIGEKGAGELIRKLICEAERRGADEKHPLFQGEDWVHQCQIWKQKYPVVTAKHYETVEEGCTNIYAFYEELSKAMQEGQTLMVSVGTSRVAGSQAFRVKKGQRFITNPNTASMGFCLPAATGICVAQPGKPVVCVTGEGSLQMNLQELQTIWQNRLPVKLFVINNQGYHSIRQTQQSYFEPPLVGVGAESGDLSFPDLSKIIPAYGFSYRAVHAAEELPETLHQVLEETGASVCEVFVTKYQKTEPKTSAKKLPDGSMVSAPLEDMYPFLSKEELEENMFTETNGEMQ